MGAKPPPHFTSLNKTVTSSSLRPSQISEKQLSKKQEEWDKDIPSVPIHRVLGLNRPEWFIIVFGIVGAAINGFIWPSFALLFGEILTVFALPPDEILDEIHMWAALFIVVGVVSGVGQFLRVGEMEEGGGEEEG